MSPLQPASELLRLLLLVAAGPLAGAGVLGLGVGLLQAVTGIQEPSLGFLARATGALVGIVWALHGPLGPFLELAGRLLEGRA